MVQDDLVAPQRRSTSSAWICPCWSRNVNYRTQTTQPKTDVIDIREGQNDDLVLAVGWRAGGGNGGGRNSCGGSGNGGGNSRRLQQTPILIKESQNCRTKTT